MRPIRAGLCLIALCASASAIELRAEWRLDEQATVEHIRAQHEYDAAVERSLPAAIQRVRLTSYRFDGNDLVATTQGSSERIPIRWIEQEQEHALLRGRTRGQNFEIYLELIGPAQLRMHSTLDAELSHYIWRPGRPGELAEILDQAAMSGEVVTDLRSNPNQ